MLVSFLLFILVSVAYVVIVIIRVSSIIIEFGRYARSVGPCASDEAQQRRRARIINNNIKGNKTNQLDRAHKREDSDNKTSKTTILVI